MSILKVKSLFFYKNHEIKLKRFCIKNCSGTKTLKPHTTKMAEQF